MQHTLHAWNILHVISPLNQRTNTLSSTWPPIASWTVRCRIRSPNIRRIMHARFLSLFNKTLLIKERGGNCYAKIHRKEAEINAAKQSNFVNNLKISCNFGRIINNDCSLKGWSISTFVIVFRTYLSAKSRLSPIFTHRPITIRYFPLLTAKLTGNDFLGVCSTWRDQSL